MERPRALYLAFEVFPRAKGATSHIASMVAALARNHAPVWLVCLGYGDMPARQNEGAITILRHKLYHPNLLKRALSFAGFVKESIRAAGPGLELCVFRDPWSGVPALQTLPASAAVVFEVNALPTWELPYAYPAVVENFALLHKLRDQERFCLLSSDRVLTVSSLTREALIHLGAKADQVSVVPNSAADVFFDGAEEPLPVPEMAAGEWFGYVGSLQSWQGLETAMEALALVREDLPGVRMLVAYHGRKTVLKTWTKRARKLGLSDHIRFARSLPPAALAAALRRLRFTVAPLAETRRNTVQGCCPVKVIESLAAGVPVLASNLRVTRELLSPGVDSLLLPAGDPRAWAVAFRRMFAEPGLADRLACGARRRAEKSFSREKVHAMLRNVMGRTVIHRAATLAYEELTDRSRSAVPANRPG